MWKIPGRTFLQWLQPLQRANGGMRSSLQDLGAARKLFLGVPVVLVGAGAVLAGSQLVANTAIRTRTTPRRTRQLNTTPSGGNTQEVQSPSPSGYHGYSELEQLLMQQFLNNASRVVHGKNLMTAADFVAFIRGATGARTEENITGAKSGDNISTDSNGAHNLDHTTRAKTEDNVTGAKSGYNTTGEMAGEMAGDNISTGSTGGKHLDHTTRAKTVENSNGAMAGDTITGDQVIQPKNSNTPNTGFQVGLKVQREAGLQEDRHSSGAPRGCPLPGVQVRLGGHPEREDGSRQSSRIPQKWQTSAHFFRDLGDDGLLDLPDFVLLLHILTTSPEFFKPIYKVLTNGGAALLNADDFNHMKLALAPKQPAKATTTTTRGRRQQWGILQAPWKVSTGLIPALCQGSMVRMGLGTGSGCSDAGGYRGVVSRVLTWGTTGGEAADRTEGDVSCISTHLFGTRGQLGGIRFWDLKRFILNVHREALEVEFAELAGDKEYLTLQEFGAWIFRFAAEDRQDKMADPTTCLHGNHDVHVTIDDLQSLHDVIRYHMKDVTDAMTMYTVLTPSGLTSPRDVQEVVQLGSGLRLETGLCEAVFRLFSTSGGKEAQGRRFDVDLFSDVMQRRRSFGLPLKVTEDVSVTLEADGELEEEEL